METFTVINFETTAMQPGIGSDIDRYHGVGDGNADLLNAMIDRAAAMSRRRSTQEFRATRIWRSDLGSGQANAARSPST